MTMKKPMLDVVPSRFRSISVFLVAIVMLIGVLSVEELYLARIEVTSGDSFPSWLRNLDIAGFILVDRGLSLPFLDPIMRLVTRTGSTIFWLLVSAFLWMRDKKREAVLLAIGIIVGGLIFLPIKMIFPRARPYLILEGTRTLDIEGGGSFPSGHSKNGFTAAVILGSKWKKLRGPLYILAFMIGVSRVYVGLHWPFDVIVGSMSGWIIGKITVLYEAKIMATLSKIAPLSSAKR